MKKLVLILVLAFSFVSLGNAKQENLNNVTPSDCWDFADAVETYHCGGVSGCDLDYFEYAYNTCIELTQ